MHVKMFYFKIVIAYTISREDKGVRELLPHIGPIPILIPLKLFLVTNGGKFKFQITY